MPENFKNKILKLAKTAVLKAEKELSGENGQLKKQTAVKYVITHLPVPEPVKLILGFVLSAFIDSAIEISVAYMNNKDTIEE